MIPEIHRKLPNDYFSKGLYKWTKLTHTSRCLRKYGKPNENDIVLDIGAYIGEFSIPSSYFSEKVYAVEPSNIFRRLHYNCYHFENIKPKNYGIWNKNSLQKFSIKDKTADTSISKFVKNDIEDNTEKYINCYRLDSLSYIDDITFLKIDGEGSEPEILKSLGKFRPKRISIDVSNERNRKSTKSDVIKILHSMDYQLVRYNRYNRYNVIQAEL